MNYITNAKLLTEIEELFVEKLKVKNDWHTYEIIEVYKNTEIEIMKKYLD